MYRPHDGGLKKCSLSSFYPHHPPPLPGFLFPVSLYGGGGTSTVHCTVGRTKELARMSDIALASYRLARGGGVGANRENINRGNGCNR